MPSPVAERSETLDRELIDRQEEVSTTSSPFRELIIALHELITDGVDADQPPYPVALLEPRPEPGCNVERAVPVLRLDQDVRVDEMHQRVPTRSASASNVLCFFVPSSL